MGLLQVQESQILKPTNPLNINFPKIPQIILTQNQLLNFLLKGSTDIKKRLPVKVSIDEDKTLEVGENLFSRFYFVFLVVLLYLDLAEGFDVGLHFGDFVVC